jgi:hypothetical protein
MHDKVLETRNLVRRNGNVDELLGLLLRGGHGSKLQHVLPEVGYAEDGVRALESGFQRGDVVVIGRSKLRSGFEKSFGTGGVFVACDAAHSPAFGEHAAGNGASKTARGAADYDKFGHGLLRFWWVGQRLMRVFGVDELLVLTMFDGLCCCLEEFRTAVCI